EERSNRIRALSYFRPRLDGDAQRRGIIEDEGQECVSDQPLAPVGHEKIESGQMRELHLAVLVTLREIVQASVFEVPDAGDAHTIAVDDCPRHYGDFRSPGSILRGKNGDPPRDDAEKQCDEDQG